MQHFMDPTASSPGARTLSGLSEGGTLWESAHAISVWQRLTVGFLAIICLLCVHYVLFSLHRIVLPFFLSGFIVFALQPSVESLFLLLAGLSAPYRWFICCCPRRRRGQGAGGSLLYGSCCVTRGRSPSFTGDATVVRSPRSPRRPDSESTDEEAQRESEPLLEQGPVLAAMLGEGFARFIAVSVALLFLLWLSSLFFMLLGKAALHMKENWEVYRRGLVRIERMQERMVDIAAKEVGLQASVDRQVKLAYDKIMEEAQDLLWYLVNAMLGGLSEGVARLLLVLLYVMFWLMQPLPTGGKVSSVVRSYLWKKSFVSFLYGFSTTILLMWLHIDLALVFGVAGFFLNYVPEVGAFLSMLLPIPVILLDSRIHNPVLVLVIATMGQFVLKFMIGNILEVKLVERDKEMSIHPVWIILGLSYFGYIWGSMGALLSVPMLAMMKTAALSLRGEVIDETSVVPSLAESFLACFEGRNTCWARPNNNKASCFTSERDAGPGDSDPRASWEAAPPPPLFMPPPGTPSEVSPVAQAQGSNVEFS
mmetsp:Transcript_49420/g.105210  ORF Transcript_49420/g.105210 Transcript_49420/m.105210 type:complete len:536 (+) Transcript_49420:228-1835(+)